MNQVPRFPVGGSRQNVYDYLRSFGFIESKWSDKHWIRADGYEVHIYGSGSMARLTKERGIVMNGPLDQLDIALAGQPLDPDDLARIPVQL